MTVIEIKDLYKYYGSQRAIGPVSATIEEGEIVGLLGLNGAGKTTTLRVLACDLLPSAGSVKVDGLDVVERPDEVRARTGYLPDDPPLYGDMKVREFLVYAARLRGVDGAEVDQRVGEAVKKTQLSKVEHQLISTLSHGYRQRVGIAQAIVHNPRFVVLDEPNSGLDPRQIVEMRQLVRNLGGDHTVLISSHILSEIEQTCDRLLVIRDGEIVASGSEDELSSRMLEGIRLDVTVRIPDGGSPADAKGVLEGLPGVTSVDTAAQTEPGERVASFSVSADRDVREPLCKALVAADIGLLELGRGERELENVFLRLAEGTDAAERGPARAPSAEEATA